MITHTYDEFPEVVAAAKQALDSACNRSEASRKNATLETVSCNLDKVDTMLRGIRSNFTARPGATMDAQAVEYLDAQLSMIQDAVRASLHLSDLTRGEITSDDDLPEFMQWVEGLACIKMMHDNHIKEREPQ